MPQEFHLHQNFACGGFSLHVIHRGGPLGSDIGVARELIFDRLADDSSAHYTPPVTVIRHDEAQQLMDELWRVGVRPSEGTGSAGSLRQAEAHIASLRAIAFKLAGVEDPKR